MHPTEDALDMTELCSHGRQVPSRSAHGERHSDDIQGRTIHGFFVPRENKCAVSSGEGKDPSLIGLREKASLEMTGLKSI